MTNASYIDVKPMTREGLYTAYSRGLISFETMTEKLKELNEAEELTREAC